MERFRLLVRLLFSLRCLGLIQLLSVDLNFWYNSAFGSPTARALGVGYIQELVARLTNVPISVHNSSTNATVNDNPTTFPLGQSIYVDATHDTVVLNGTSMLFLSPHMPLYVIDQTTPVLTALNLSNFAADGPLPSDHIPPNRSFKTSHLAPFASNVQFQRMHPSRFAHRSLCNVFLPQSSLVSRDQSLRSALSSTTASHPWGACAVALRTILTGCARYRHL